MNQNNITKLVNQALNKTVWQAKKGTGSFLTFDMGDKVSLKKKDGSSYLKGSVHLWVYLCDWEIQSHGKVLAKNDDNDHDIFNAVSQFEGQQIFSIDKVDANTVLIQASNELSITLSGNNEGYKDDDDFFILYVPEASISFNRVNGLYTEPRDAQ